MIFMGSIRASIRPKERVIIDPRIIRRENISKLELHFALGHSRARNEFGAALSRKIDRAFISDVSPWLLPGDHISRDSVY